MEKLFKRKIYNELLKWKEKKGETALLIEGARRVGKSTIVEEFGKNEYEEYVLIDFSRVNQNFKDVFNDLSDLDIFFRNLFLLLNAPSMPKGSLMIFDEIQFCPKARQAIKHLVKDGRYSYIETGSLVSIKENIVDIQIPSEEEKLEMYPMDYEEFLDALGYSYEYQVLKDIYDNKKYNVDTAIHKKFMDNFRLYLCVGGMPSVVSKYIETKDFFKVDNEKKLIYNLYLNDLEKIDKKYGTFCSLIYKAIPSMLSKHNNKFIFSKVNSRKDSLKLLDSVDKLIESKIVNIVYKANEPLVGLASSKENNMFKLYFSDVGIYTSILYGEDKNEISNIYQRIIFDKLDSNFGSLYENFVLVNLLSKNHSPYFYEWKEDNKRYEIDFLIYKEYKLSLIEVKSGNKISISSLNKFKEKYDTKIKDSLVISPKNFNLKENVIYLPFYLTNFI